jgi:hypothetical protein
MMIVDHNYNCIADIANHTTSLKSLGLYGKMNQNRGLPCVELPVPFVNQLQSLSLDSFDFYLDADDDSYTFVRQCTNLTALDVMMSRGMKMWNEQLLRFLPKLKVVKGAAALNPTNELAEETTMKETPAPITCLVQPRCYPMSEVFRNIVCLNWSDAMRAREVSDNTFEALRYVLGNCPKLSHLILPEERLTKKSANGPSMFPFLFPN